MGLQAAVFEIKPILPVIRIVDVIFKVGKRLSVVLVMDQFSL